ncbi:ABC-type transport system involved in cytochrome bd biosynthesis fused ATPase/permease subunit [Salinibacterium amurskyense]|uniref:ABC-type transport system involved in cytochrome bd biosynthesis fused ATPase/permease subunit n=1 Tax=Salinibacterium amurskyense TaxID=205941 RepID=A0A2M9D6F0_9MICO|nr:ATP-binding cassette domain-containing protein [Salinibacterium amurskyense]PJJ81230.1 ABC-type transport system involved in cytochrome bd biosynthesis fused ATPase/permease subunit [Salinibacterium amurskyense]RLQ83249.1 ATP-binding cassette domain-containing protein [Salinibacterium amurskyense]GHD81231.1 HlyB/MsbA family ABC transporter [Salinibacterium amurskyense]
MIHFRLLRLAGTATALLSAIVLAGIALSAVAIAQAIATAALFTGIVTGAALESLTVATIVFTGALLVRPVLSMARELTVHAVAGRIKVQLRSRILTAEITAGPLASSTSRSGERQSLLVDAVENLEPYFGRYLPQLVVTFVTGGSLVAALIMIDPVVGIVVGAIALAVPFIPRFWDAALAGRGEQHWAAYSSLHADVVDSIRGMPTLKALGAVHLRRQQLSAAGDSLLTATLSQLKLSLVESGLTSFFLVAGPAVALLVGAARVSSGELAPTSLFLVTMLSFEVFRPFRDLSQYWHAGYAGVSAGNRISALLTNAEHAGSGAAGGAATATGVTAAAPHGLTSPHPAAHHSDIAVRADSLSFRYPGADSDALHNLNFTIPTGSTVAIVGESGSGKSTFASAMLGFAQPTTGELVIAGASTALLGHEGCSPLVSLVAQDPVLFTGSIRHNLQLVAPGASDSDLSRALFDAGAEELLDPSRSGLDAPVGDNGGLLSGGQRQRLAITRALLRDSPILLLDEASSALDARRENAILERLRETRRADGSARTVIVIAHRLAPIRSADLVLVFENGCLAESGTYDDLIARDGVLTRLHAAQTSGVLA